MRGGIFWSFLICAGVAVGDEAAARLKELETVRSRIVAEAHTDKPNLKAAQAAASSQKRDGSWDGIDYGAMDRMIWPPMAHLDRLMDLAQAVESGRVSGPERAGLSQAFVRGFDFWVARDPKSSNWWYNEIGAPLELYRLMLLAEPLLTEGRLEKGCALLARAKLAMTGQNLLWLAESVIGRACLQRDPALMAEAFRRIEAEVVVTEKEGVQPDFSFHQHGAQLYNGGYGSGFAASAPRFALLAQGTSFAMSQQKVAVLVSYLLDGQQWMIRGSTFDYSASGRDLTRPNSGSARGYAGRARTLLKLDAAPRRTELERLAARLEQGMSAERPALTGHRHFWRSDYTAHHTTEWLVSVRMTSDRLLQTEVVNEENLLGEHLSDGVLYLYRTGGEYRNIFPVWDWARLPGITVEHDRPPRRIRNGCKGSRSFAGGVSDGVCGVSAMDFERDGLTAKKAWFFFEGQTVCLGADITSTNGYQVLSSANQCLAQGTVTVKRAGGAAAVLASPEKLAKPEWVHHDGVGYVFLDGGQSVCTGSAVQTGSWKRISLPQKADPVSAEVFSLWVDHGRSPKAATYAYVLTPARSASELEAYAAAPPLRVIANTPQAQAVEQARSGALQVAFYQAGAVESGAWGKVAVDVPCLLMVSRQGQGVVATVCDPAATRRRVAVSVKGVRREVPLPAGAQAGSSVTVPL